MKWQPGDPLPEGEMWSWAMLEQFTKKSRRTLKRRGHPPEVPGLPGVFDPKTVRAFYSSEFQGVGLRRSA